MFSNPKILADPTNVLLTESGQALLVEAPILSFQSGFDSYANPLIEWTGSVGTGAFALSSPGRFGYGQYISLNPGLGARSGLNKICLTTGSRRLIVGFSHKITTTPKAMVEIAHLVNASGVALCGIGVTPQGSVVVINETNQWITNGVNVPLATSAVLACPIGPWFYVEFDFYLDTTGLGSYVVAINGMVVLSGKQVTLGTENLAYGIDIVGSADSPQFDDVYVISFARDSVGDSFLGDIKIVPLMPTASGRVTPMAQVGGVVSQPWTAVNEVPPDNDISYLSATIGQIECLKIPSPDTISYMSTILAVVVNGYARENEAVAHVLAVGVGNGVTESFGTGSSLALTYGYTQRTMYRNPITNQPWLLSDFATLEVAVSQLS